MSTAKIQNEATFSNNLFPPPGRDFGFFSDSATVAPERSRRPDPRIRERSAPVLVEATVHWWRTDERRSTGLSNQFGVMPSTAVRFRCIGALMPKYPKRYRIELAQALDWLPELTERERKLLGAALVEAIAIKLGVDVAPLNCDVMDLEPTGEDRL